MRKSRYVLALVLAWLSLTAGFCSPTGLNIIPTADVLSKDTFSALTPWSGGMRFGPDGENYSLLQVGAGHGIEVGMDQRLKDGAADMWLNAKWKFLEEEGMRPAVAVGVQNVSRYSNDQPYMVMSKSLTRSGGTKFHAGAIKIDGQSRTILGLGKSFGSRMAFQADYVSGNESSMTAGFAMRLADRTALWVARSFPNETGVKGEYFVRMGWNASF